MTFRYLAFLVGIIAVVLFVSREVFAQDESSLRSKIESVRYPALAKVARIEGNVRLRSNQDGIVLIDGNPLLVPTASDSLKILGRVSEVEVEANYHFVLLNDAEIRTSQRIVKKGNRLTRLILRPLKFKTEEVVEDSVCIETPNPPMNRFDIKLNTVDVWIYASIGCQQLQVSKIASR